VCAGRACARDRSVGTGGRGRSSIRLGTTLGDEALRVAKRPRDVEKVLDPKQELRAAFTAVAGSPRRRRRLEDFYTRIGEQVDLAKLQQVPAFSDLERDLREALCKIGIVRAH
jgi:hypothetical protein